jgi:leucyl aminopeptidase
MISMATLTGAARVALGPELAPVYTADADFAQRLKDAGASCDDPVWPMPLHDGYDSWLDSDIADLSSTGKGGFAGSITAALFLRRFAADAKAWAHFDIFAWNPTARPGRPAGGEMLGARALWRVLKDRFGG